MGLLVGMNIGIIMGVSIFSTMISPFLTSTEKYIETSSEDVVVKVEKEKLEIEDTMNQESAEQVYLEGNCKLWTVDTIYVEGDLA